MINLFLNKKRNSVLLIQIKMVNLGNQIELTFNKVMNDPIGKHSEFSLTKKSISSVALRQNDNKTLILTLSSNFFKSDGNDTLTLLNSTITTIDGSTVKDFTITLINNITGLQFNSNYLNLGYVLPFLMADNNYYYIQSGSSVLKKVRKSDNVEVASLTTNLYFQNGIYDPTNNVLLCCDWIHSYVYKINLSTFTITETIPVAFTPYDITIDIERDKMYVCNASSTNVKVYTYSTRTYLRDINIGIRGTNNLEIDVINNKLYLYTGIDAMQIDLNTDICTILFSNMSSDSVFGFLVDSVADLIFISSYTFTKIVVLRLSDLSILNIFDCTGLDNRQIFKDNNKYYVSLFTSNLIGLIG